MNSCYTSEGTRDRQTPLKTVKTAPRPISARFPDRLVNIVNQVEKTLTPIPAPLDERTDWHFKWRASGFDSDQKSCPLTSFLSFPSHLHPPKKARFPDGLVIIVNQPNRLCHPVRPWCVSQSAVIFGWWDSGIVPDKKRGVNPLWVSKQTTCGGLSGLNERCIPGPS